jgi:hypothetical protein
MSVQHTVGLLAAGIVTSTLTAFVDRPASAQAVSGGDDKIAVTAVGCLQRERDYRREHSKGRGGFLGTGAGAGDEYVLINASVGAPSMPIAAVTEEESTNCLASRRTGQDFELTGGPEDHLSGLVGRRVVITGMLKHAKHDSQPVGTSGTFTPAPTSGGPLPGDLKLREINVEEFSLAPVAAPAAFPNAVPELVPSLPAAEPEPSASAESPQQPEQTAAAPLPKTASPLPLIGLIGLLSLAGAFALRLCRR